MSERGKRVICTDILSLQEALVEMRKGNDRIILQLNNVLPSHSFSRNVDVSQRCQSLNEQLNAFRRARMELIQRCINENQERISELKATGASERNARIVQDTLRMCKSEMDVEEIISEQSGKTFHGRCRTFL